MFKRGLQVTSVVILGNCLYQLPLVNAVQKRGNPCADCLLRRDTCEKHWEKRYCSFHALTKAR